MTSYSTGYKVALMGLGAVGKSAITVRFMNGNFIERYDPTIEDSYIKNMELDGSAITLEILDTSGQEEYSALRDIFIKSCSMFLLTYSIISKPSWDHISKIYSILVERKKKAFCIVLAGNKCDLEEEREVSQDDVDAFIAEHAVKYHHLTSAKTGYGVKEVFENVARMIRHWNINHPTKREKKKGDCLLL